MWSDNGLQTRPRAFSNSNSMTGDEDRKLRGARLSEIGQSQRVPEHYINGSSYGFRGVSAVAGVALQPREILALEEAHRIEWCRAPANLEVQFRRVDIAGLARVRNYLPAPDPG